jgi:hypothetical protein
MAAVSWIPLWTGLVGAGADPGSCRPLRLDTDPSLPAAGFATLPALTSQGHACDITGPESRALLETHDRIARSGGARTDESYGDSRSFLSRSWLGASTGIASSASHRAMRAGRVKARASALRIGAKPPGKRDDNRNRRERPRSLGRRRLERVSRTGHRRPANRVRSRDKGVRRA